MTAYTDFHYSPTGSGVISGAQVLEQTEQGINGLGQYVQDNISGAIDTANQALTIAQTANTNATIALNTANSFSDAITTANQTANNALTTAQSAQSTANAASSLATTANNNATSALNAANAATSNVNILTSTVNGLGNRMTAAENAISANAGNITTLQTNLQTTNNNVTAAANAASSAQATATSAQSTATLARNQAYVLRYTGTTITGGGTIAYADIDNTDNIKAGDKIIDISGAIYDIASVDIANHTATVGATAIINLAVLPALFNSANTWTGTNTYQREICISGDRDAYIAPMWENASSGIAFLNSDVTKTFVFGQYTTDANNRKAIDATKGRLLIRTGERNGETVIDFEPSASNATLGSSNFKWKTLNGINPGALGIPSGVKQSILEYITDVNLSWNNQVTAVRDGYIIVTINDAAGNSIFIFNNTKQYTNSCYGNGSQGTGRLSCILPVNEGDLIYIFIKAAALSDVFSADLYVMNGNVNTLPSS